MHRDDDQTRPFGINFELLTWSADDTREYLDANPLPVDFTWKHKDGGQRPVQPSHTQVNGYGKWLRETPYYQGLFEEIHRIVASAGAHLPDIESVVAELLRRHPSRQFGPRA